MKSSTTFRVSEELPNVSGYRQNETFFKSVTQLPHYKRNFCTEVLKGTAFPKNCALPMYENGFVGTVTECYNGHHNLIIRPDDVWMAIVTQLSFYINKEAENFRAKFVNFEGEKELEVEIDGTLKEASYEKLVTLMTEKIDENLVDPEVKSWLLPSFSTTTKNDVVACGVVFMASMKKYFDFKFNLACGIPYVTIEGTADDWEAISERLEKLKEYELAEWYTMLKPILHQFIQAKKGEPDISFWQRICSNHDGGSGPTYLSGWITAFCVFNEDGNWIGGNKRQEIYDDDDDVIESEWSVIDTDQIPPGIVEVDVKIRDDGKLYDSCMFAGHLGIEWSQDKKTLKPSAGWVICLKHSQKINNDLGTDEAKKRRLFM